MIQPSMTIETVHGIKETVVFNNFVVGLHSSKMKEGSERESRDREEAPAKDEKQR